MSNNRYGGFRDYDTYSESYHHRNTNRNSYNRRRKYKKRTRNRIIICSVAALLIILMIVGLGSCAKSCGSNPNVQNGTNNTTQNGETPTAVVNSKETTLAKAKTSAAQYDYDTAIAQVKNISGYSTDSELQSLVSTWEQEKASLVEYPHDQITHIFVHSLVYETELAFDDDYKADGYNLVMTTVDEFNAMIEQMYNNGYVMVSMHDICTFDAQGNRVDHKIMLPEGKKAFVLSQDDLNYYHCQDGDGIANKLVFDENGKVKTAYIQQDGTTAIGDFDMVPIIDTFVEKHPDFAYKGHKGVLALTGYNGVLGYRTDSVYTTLQDLDLDQEQFLADNPNFNYQQEVEDAKKIADAMKANGWEFATHTWGHITLTTADMEWIQTDTEKWLAYVASIVGPTDIILYPYGGDIAGVEEYDFNNEKFSYLYEQGLRYFCNVDSNQYWTQKGSNYFRMGRRNVDGYRMYHDGEGLTDLFDVSTVFDPKRPTPVPNMSDYY